MGGWYYVVDIRIIFMICERSSLIKLWLRFNSTLMNEENRVAVLEN